MTAPARLEVVIASLTTATREKVGLEQVETLGKEPESLVARVHHHTFECDLNVHVQQIPWRIAVESSARLNDRPNPLVSDKEGPK